MTQMSSELYMMLMSFFTHGWIWSFMKIPGMCTISKSLQLVYLLNEAAKVLVAGLLNVDWLPAVVLHPSALTLM